MNVKPVQRFDKFGDVRNVQIGPLTISYPMFSVSRMLENHLVIVLELSAAK